MGCPVGRTADADGILSGLFSRRADALADPFTLYARMRASAAVSYSEMIKAFVVTRHAEIAEVLADPETFSSRATTGAGLGARTKAALERISATDAAFAARAEQVRLGSRRVLLNSDPPAHSQQRRIVDRAFSLRRVRAAEPRIRAFAQDLITGLRDRDTVDLVQDFAVPLPVSVIADQLGVPLDRVADFKRWSDALTAPISDSEMDDTAFREALLDQFDFFEFTDRLAEDRRRAPGDDMLSVIATAVDDAGHPLTRQEVLGMVAQFMVAGNETTTKLISAAALRLARDPAMQQRLRDEPAQIPAFVEEVVRLDSPVQGLFRVATRDCRLGEVTIAQGCELWLAWGSANRDEQIFERPACLEEGRDGGWRHFAFGHGIHQCVGQNLARAETRIALEELLSSFSTIESAQRETEYLPSFIFRGPAHVPLRLTPHPDWRTSSSGAASAAMTDRRPRPC